MPYYPPPFEGSAIKYQYVNPDQPSGNSLTSSVIGNTKTSFASSAIIPEWSAVIGGIAHITGRGLFGSGIVSLGLTVSIEMAGVTVASATVIPALNLSNMPWSIDVSATILANGAVEVQGEAIFSSATGATVVPIPNTLAFTMPVTGGVPVTISAKYGAIAVGGTISLRQMIVQVT